MEPPTLHELFAEAKRELHLRRRVYPRWVAEKYDLNQSTADFRIACMEAIVELLRDKVERESGQQRLFAKEPM